MKKISGVNFSEISFVLMDMDGVMSDGSLIYFPDGEIIKVFHAHDGYGIERGKKLGLKFGIITGKVADVNKLRAKRLKIDELYEGCDNKLVAYESIRSKYNLKPENFCFIGDDVFDLPLLMKVGFSCAPSNAIEEVKQEVHYVTKIQGGRGAVREVIDFILRKKKLLD